MIQNPQTEHCNHEMTICRLYQANPMRKGSCPRTDCYADTRPLNTQNSVDKLVTKTKLRIRQLFLDDAKCELCEKIFPEDGYDGQNEGCEKGLCIECAIDKALREFAEHINKLQTKEQTL